MAGYSPMLSELPSEIAAVLPSSPFAQLELANKIANYALAQKVAQMEAEGQQYREAALQKNNQIKSLERRVTSLEQELQEAHARNKAAIEEAHRLQSERTALIDTVKKQNRELSKLESLKKSLKAQLLDDTEAAAMEPSSAAVDLSADRLVSEVLSSAAKPNNAHSTSSYGAMRGAPTPMANIPGRASGPFPSFMQQQSQQPGYATPGMQGMGAPGSQAYSSYSQPSSPHVDGKEFFRQARASLSYEQFSQFLHNIKELNAGRQSREETLRRARDIFGATHQDMYGMFEKLLSKHINAAF